MLLIGIFFIFKGAFLIWNSYNYIKSNHEIGKEFAIFKGSVGLMAIVVGVFSLINFFL